MNFKNFQEKKSFVQEVFSGVANKYDIMNDCMSFGLHRLWKKKFVNMIPAGDFCYLDLASGSGDVAMRLMDRLRHKQINNFTITCLDQNQEMLDIGEGKMLDSGYLQNNVNFTCSPAEKMPLESNSVDCVMVSFGIRNFSDISGALCEIYRILKPNGTFWCLEFSPSMSNDILQKGYNLYSRFIPKIGKLVAKNEPAYQYLVDSIANFPNKIRFSKMIKESGFVFVDFDELSGGICNIHQAKK